VTFLGGRTPVEHLARVVRTIEPDLVALSAVGDVGSAAYGRTLKEVLGALGEARVAIGGNASTKYRDLATALGAITVETPAEWEALLA
jgi:endonuclease/exonuclease/phosphatase family metal-dependent hydrolase